MEIEYANNTEERYGDLKPGDVFKSDYNIYMVIDKTDSEGDLHCVNIEDGSLNSFFAHQTITPVKAKVVVE